jgi:hypothetical protein
MDSSSFQNIIPARPNFGGLSSFPATLSAGAGKSLPTASSVSTTASSVCTELSIKTELGQVVEKEVISDNDLALNLVKVMSGRDNEKAHQKIKESLKRSGWCFNDSTTAEAASFYQNAAYQVHHPTGAPGLRQELCDYVEENRKNIEVNICSLSAPNHTRKVHFRYNRQ